MPAQGRYYIVVGGAGLVGSAVARALMSDQSGDVIICDTFGDANAQKWQNLPSNLQDIWHPGALTANLDKAWREIAGVIMLCDAGPANTDVDGVFEAAFHLPRRVWDFCVAKQRPMSWASSSHVYGAGISNLSSDPKEIAAFQPVTAFGQAKRAFDLFASRQSEGPNRPPVTTGLRLSSVYGPSEAHKGEAASLPVRAMAHARAGTNLMLWENSADMQRDWVHVNDAAAAIAARIASESSGFYDIGTGVGTSTTELCNLVESVSGKTLVCDWTIPAPANSISLSPADTAGLSGPFLSLTEGLATL